MKMVEWLTFDDVLLVPQFSSVVPSDADTGTVLAGMKLQIPILSAAMDTVTEGAMMAAMAAAGGAGVLHKNLSPAEQHREVCKARAVRGCHAAKRSALMPISAIAVGAKDWQQRLDECESMIDLVVVDSAHGHSANVISAVSEIRKKFPSLKIMAGNVVTADAVKALADAGADIVKVGVGSGSVCTTRVVSGCGAPQFTAIVTCSAAADACGVQIVADGGIRNSGDIVKAIAAGADAVMIGSMLAGTDESPGDRVIPENGGVSKAYRGMGSVGAMERGSKDRYGQDGVSKDKLVAEGVEAMVPYRGSVASVLHQLIGGLKSGMGYVGAKTIEELQSKAQFIRVTSAGLREGGVHDVIYR